MGRTQQFIDEFILLMQNSHKFTEIKRFVSSSKDVDLHEFPVCVLVVDEDDIERVGHRNRHTLRLLISFTFLDHNLEGNRYSYTMADNLEELITQNHQLNIEDGTTISIHLVKKSYELDISETQIMDGVVCEVECRFFN